MMKASSVIPGGELPVDEPEVVVDSPHAPPPPPPPPPAEPLLDHEDSTVCGIEDRRSSPWPDIHPELLGLVLKRLRLDDRVHMRAACRPWHSASLLKPLPLPFPWITLPDGAFLSVLDGKIHRMPVPADACCQSSFDNWLFLMHTDGSCSLMDPFSQTRLELPIVVSVWRQERHYRYNASSLSYKLAVPLPLDLSPSSIVAAMIRDSDIRNTLCVSQPYIGSYAFRDDKDPLLHLWDAVFFQGKLHVVSLLGKLSMLEFCKEDLGGSLNIRCLINSFGDHSGLPENLPDDDLYMSVQYLVECGGKLLSVRRFLRDVSDFSSERSDDVVEIFQTAGFDVLEADLSTNPCQWRKVSDFGGNAIFISQQGSKSLPAGNFTEYKEDCIYFMCDYDCPIPVNPLCDSGVFNIRSGTITPLMSETTQAQLHCNGQWRPTWVFTPEGM